MVTPCLMGRIFGGSPSRGCCPIYCGSPQGGYPPNVVGGLTAPGEGEVNGPSSPYERGEGSWIGHPGPLTPGAHLPPGQWTESLPRALWDSISTAVIMAQASIPFTILRASLAIPSITFTSCCHRLRRNGDGRTWGPGPVVIHGVWGGRRWRLPPLMVTPVWVFLTDVDEPPFNLTLI